MRSQLPARWRRIGSLISSVALLDLVAPDPCCDGPHGELVMETAKLMQGAGLAVFAGRKKQDQR